MNRQDVTIEEESLDESDSDDSSNFLSEDDVNTSWWLDDGIELPDLDGKKSSSSVSVVSFPSDLDDDLPDIVSTPPSITLDNQSDVIDCENDDLGFKEKEQLSESGRSVQDVPQQCIENADYSKLGSLACTEDEETTGGQSIQQIANVTPCISTATPDVRNNFQKEGKVMQTSELQQHEAQGETRKVLPMEQCGHSHATVTNVTSNTRELEITLCNRSNNGNRSDTESCTYSYSGESGCTSLDSGRAEIDTSSKSFCDINAQSIGIQRNSKTESDSCNGDASSIRDIGRVDSSSLWYQVVDRESFLSPSQSDEPDVNHPIQGESISMRENIDYSAFLIGVDYIVITPETAPEEKNTGTDGNYDFNNILPGMGELSVSDNTKKSRGTDSNCIKNRLGELHHDSRDTDTSDGDHRTKSEQNNGKHVEKVKTDTKSSHISKITSASLFRQDDNTLHEVTASVQQLSSNKHVVKSSTVSSGILESDFDANNPEGASANSQETFQDACGSTQQGMGMVSQNSGTVYGDGSIFLSDSEFTEVNVVRDRSMRDTVENRTLESGIRNRNTCKFSVGATRPSKCCTERDTVKLPGNSEKDNNEPTSEIEKGSDNIRKNTIAEEKDTSMDAMNTSYASVKSSPREKPCVYKLLGSLTRRSNSESSPESIQTTSLQSIPKEITRETLVEQHKNPINDFCYSDISEDSQEGNQENRRSTFQFGVMNTNNFSFMDNSLNDGTRVDAGQPPTFIFSDISDDETENNTGEIQNMSYQSVVRQSELDKSRYNLNTSLETEFYFSDISQDEVTETSTVHKNCVLDVNITKRDDSACNVQEDQCGRKSPELAIKETKMGSYHGDKYNRNNNASQLQAKRICRKYNRKRHNPKSPTKHVRNTIKQTKLENRYSDITEDSSDPDKTDTGQRNMVKPLKSASSSSNSNFKMKRSNSNISISHSVSHDEISEHDSQSFALDENSNTSSVCTLSDSECQNNYSSVSTDSEMPIVDSNKSQNFSRTIQYSEGETESDEDVGSVKMHPKGRKNTKRSTHIEGGMTDNESQVEGHQMSSFIVSDSESESSNCEADSESDGNDNTESEDLSDTVEENRNDVSSRSRESDFAQNPKGGSLHFSAYSSHYMTNASYNSDFVHRAKMASKNDDADSGISDNSTTKSCELSIMHSTETESKSDKTYCENNNGSFFQDRSKYLEMNIQKSATSFVRNSGTYINSQIVEHTPITSNKTVTINTVEMINHYSPQKTTIKEVPEERILDIGVCKSVDPPSSSEAVQVPFVSDMKWERESEMKITELTAPKSIEQLSTFPVDVLISSRKNVVISLPRHCDTHCKRITLLSSARHIEFLTLESTGDEKEVSSDSTVHSDDFSTTESEEPTLNEDTIGSSTLDLGGSTFSSEGSDNETCRSDGGKSGKQEQERSPALSQSSGKSRSSSAMNKCKRKASGPPPSDQCSKLQLKPVVKLRRLHNRSITMATKAESTVKARDKEVEDSLCDTLSASNAKTPPNHKDWRKSQTNNKNSKEEFSSFAETLEKKKSKTSEKALTCLECSKTYCSKTKMLRHFNRVHQGVNVNKPHKCPVCSRCFKVKYHLSRHMLVHSGEKPHECIFCGKAFRLKTHLESHQCVHTGLRVYTCELCIKTFAHRKPYKEHLAVHKNEKKHICVICRKEVYCVTTHMMTHSEELPYGCDICEERFSRLRELKIHGVEHSSRSFKCKQCHQNFQTLACLRLHRKCHSGDTPYSCDICKQSFAHQNYLRIHLQAHTGKKPYACRQCGMCFSQRERLASHSLVHLVSKSLKCYKCGKSFLRKSHLKSHQKVHSGENPDGYCCNICDKTFKQTSELEAHYHVDHQVPKALANQVPCEICDIFVVDMEQHLQTHRKEELYQCKVCLKQLADKTTLKNHMLIHSGEKPLQCLECSKCFRLSSVLKKHHEIHSNENPYQCSDCDYSCSDVSSLIKHFRKHSRVPQFVCKFSGCKQHFRTSTERNKHHKIHTNKRNYVCNQCGKSLSTASNLKTHLLVHTGIKPHVCHLCKKRFRQSQHLKRHLLTHSNTFPYPCDKCEKKYRTAVSLKSHKLSVHCEETPVTCTLCSATFSTCKAKDQHFKENHGQSEIPMTMKEASKGLDCQDKTEEKTIVCTVLGCCGKFRNKFDLKNHLKTIHSKKKTEVCNLCRKQFRSKTHLKFHMLRTHPEEKPFKSRNIKQVHCWICGLSFKRKLSLNNHIDKVHGNQEPSRHNKCDHKFTAK